MKKTTKDIITGILIFIATSLVGFTITLVSFNLADAVTRTQLRLLLVTDVAILLAIGTAAWYIYDSKSRKIEREQAFNERHEKRVEKIKEQNSENSRIIFTSNYAA